MSLINNYSSFNFAAWFCEHVLSECQNSLFECYKDQISFTKMQSNMQFETRKIMVPNLMVETWKKTQNKPHNILVEGSLFLLSCFSSYLCFFFPLRFFDASLGEKSIYIFFLSFQESYFQECRQPWLSTSSFTLISSNCELT